MRSIFYRLKSIYWKLLRHCPPIYIIYTPILNIRRFFILILIFHVFVISFCNPINRMIYSPLTPFSTINNISISVKRSNFTLVFSKAAYHANPGAEENFAGSSSYILRHISLKFSYTSANNSLLLWTYKSWYSSKFFISDLSNCFSVHVICVSNIFHI